MSSACWVGRSGVQSLFQFNPKVFIGAEVRTPNFNLDILFLHGAQFVQRDMALLEQVRVGFSSSE